MSTSNQDRSRISRTSASARPSTSRRCRCDSCESQARSPSTGKSSTPPTRRCGSFDVIPRSVLSQTPIAAAASTGRKASLPARSSGGALRSSLALRAASRGAAGQRARNASTASRSLGKGEPAIRGRGCGGAATRPEARAARGPASPRWAFRDSSRCSLLALGLPSLPGEDPSVERPE